MIVSGGSLSAYWLSHYLGDIIFQFLPVIVAIICYTSFGVDIPDSWVILVVFVFVNPPFIYFLSFFFRKDSTAGIVTSVIYLFFGGICCIVVGIF